MDGHPAHPRPNRRHQQKLQTALKPTTCRQRPAEPCGRLSRLRPAHLACWAFVLSTPPTSQRMREWIPLTQHLTHQGTACTVRPRRTPASTGGAPRLPLYVCSCHACSSLAMWKGNLMEMLGRRGLGTRNSSRPHPATALQPWKGQATGEWRPVPRQVGGAGNELGRWPSPGTRALNSQD